VEWTRDIRIKWIWGINSSNNLEDRWIIWEWIRCQIMGSVDSNNSFNLKISSIWDKIMDFRIKAGFSQVRDSLCRCSKLDFSNNNNKIWCLVDSRYNHHNSLKIVASVAFNLRQEEELDLEIIIKIIMLIKQVSMRMVWSIYLIFPEAISLNKIHLGSADLAAHKTNNRIRIAMHLKVL